MSGGLDCHRPRAGLPRPPKAGGEMAGWVGGGLGLPDDMPPLCPSPPWPRLGEPVTLNQLTENLWGNCQSPGKQRLHRSAVRVIYGFISR